MTQVHQVTSNLTSLGIRVESVGVDPVEGGVIAWLAVEPGAIGLLDAAETEAVCFDEVGRVPQARVRNDSDRPVVVRSDSVVAGGKQTRVVERTAVIAAGSAVIVRVRCVEARRWAPETPASAGSFTMVGMTSRSMRVKFARQRDSVLRTTGHHGLDQGAVWREVAVELRSSRVTSRTDSYLPLVADVRARDRARARSLGVAPPSSANAALAMPHRGAAWVVVFASNAALRRHSDELVADLFEVARANESEPEGPTSVGEALARLLDARVSRVDGEGLGQPFALQSARVCGSLLMHESRVAHLSAAIG